MNRYTLLISSLLLAGCGAAVSSDDQDGKLEARIRNLLLAQEFKEVKSEILGYGDLALPVLAKVLSSPTKDEFDDLRAVRALIVLRDIGGSAPKLRPLVRRQLLAEKVMVRDSAIEALASIGSRDDVPLFVGLLYSPHYSIRYGAVKALVRLGEDEAALLAIEIWYKQAVIADESRPGPKKWLTGSIPKEIEKAKKAIRQRIDKKKEAVKGK